MSARSTDESREGLIFGFLTESKAEIFATAGQWKSEMHVTDMEGSWNHTSDDSKCKFTDSSQIFANNMMPKESITAASDLDLKMAITVSEIPNAIGHLLFSLGSRSGAVIMMIMRRSESQKLRNSGPRD